MSTVCACALISKNSCKNHITSGHLRYTDFCEVADFYCVEMHTTTMLCVNDDKGAMKALSFSVARMIHRLVHSS